MATPSTTSLASLPFYASEIIEVFKDQILIPTDDKSHRFLLGSSGNPDSTWLLNGYRTWYKRIAAAKQVHWDEIGIGQCLALSLADTKNNEPLMLAATYFWSSTLNAFLFRQGPMTPTLIDIKMLTGLDILSEINPFNLLINSSHKLKTKKIGGWSGYISEHMEQGSISEREHDLMLNRTVAHGGPWWFIQLWLTIYTNTMVDRPPLSESIFPSDYSDNEDPSSRRCMSFGEAASVYPGADQSAEEISTWFIRFYTGPPSVKMDMFVYPSDSDFELPADLNLGLINDDMVSREVFMIGVTPCLLPVGIFQGRSTSLSYEFYNPMVAARQCGLGQLPVSLHFHWLLESRGTVSSALIMSKALETRIPALGDCDRLWLSAFIHISFQAWWQEWAIHIFHQSARFFLTELIDNISPQVPDAPGPSVSNSGQRITYAPVLAPSGKTVLESIIGLTTPKVSSLLQGSIIKETTKRKAPAKDKIQKPDKKSKTDDQADLDQLDPSIEEFLDDQVMEEEVDAAAADIPEDQHPLASIAEKPSADKPIEDPSAITTADPPADDQADVAQPKKTRHVVCKGLPIYPPHLLNNVYLIITFLLYSLAASSIAFTTSANPFAYRFRTTKGGRCNNSRCPITAIFLEQYHFKFHKAKERIAERRERGGLELAVSVSKAQVGADKIKLDELVAEPIALNEKLGELRRLEADLLMKLEATREEIRGIEVRIAASPKAIEDQTAKLKASAKHLVTLSRALKPVPGSAADDAQVIDDIDQIRRKAIATIPDFIH
uniref:Aminotransferase-like n=1 Tax=Oryza minuta TaxID=63629 RepID=A0A1V1H754_ORYMI|nr:aminotransferase-like [Oryza minuta]